MITRAMVIYKCFQSIYYCSKRVAFSVLFPRRGFRDEISDLQNLMHKKNHIPHR
jgi:hypothetical protein